MIRLFTLIAIMATPFIGYSQIISGGKVLDKETQEPLPGVTIMIKGSNTGVITNLEGIYKINVQSTDSLLFSFVGYSTQTIWVGNRTSINVSLEIDYEELDEIVVTALSIKRDKASLGYAVTQMDANDVNYTKENNVMNSLSGKVAGLQVTTGNTGVDGSSRILLRGVSTIEGNNRPLVVIDGIPMSGGSGGADMWGGTDTGDALSDINPDDIESMSILKGAGASAAYGSLGMHGVILITTKSGAGKKGIGVSYGSTFTATQVYLTPDLQNEYGTGAFDSFAPIGSDGKPNLDYPFAWSYGPKLDGQEYTNWLGEKDAFVAQGDPYKDFYQTGISFTNSLALQGSTDKNSFRLSLTDQRGEGIVQNNTISRQTLNLRASSKLTNKFSVDAKVTYIKSKTENRPDLAESGANSALVLSLMPRDIRLSDVRTNYEDEFGNEVKWSLDGSFSNPYWTDAHVANESLKNRFQGMISTKFDVSNNFWITAKMGMDYTINSSSYYADKGASFQSNSRGNYGNGTGSSTIWNSDILATYKMEWNNFNVTTSLGANYRDEFGSSISVNGKGAKTDGLYQINNYLTTNIGEGSWQKLVYSYYGLSQFSFAKFLYLDVTLRNDHSSALPKTNDSYWYHSENMSFLFNELLGINSNILSRGKIRGSYAKVGNDTGPYRTAFSYGIDQTPTLPYAVASISSALPAVDLKPEITHSWEVGTELMFFNNRVNFDFTYYQSKSKDQIMSIPISGATAFASKVINAGLISSKGIEMQLNSTPLQTKNFRWDFGVNYTKSSSQVNELAEGLESIVLNRLWTVSVEARPGEEFGAIYANDYLRNKTGQKLITDGGQAQRGDRIKVGSMNPDFYGGMTNNFKYKNFTLRTLISFQKGGEFYSHGRYYRMLFGTDACSLEGREDGIVVDGINENTGNPNTIAVLPLAKNFSDLYQNEVTVDYILDASNVKLKEVVFTYTFPKALLGNFIQGASISFIGRDLFFLYNAACDIDPQASYSSGPTGVALEHSSLPSTRTLGFDFKINF